MFWKNNSLSLVLVALFLVSMVGQAVTFALLFIISISIHAIGGRVEYNEEQQQHGQPQVTLAQYVSSPRFWFESFQNWQSKFLSLAAMVIATIYLRQWGSGESKPVFAAHSETGR